MESLKDAGLPADYAGVENAYKGVNELRLLSNTLTYQSCVLFLHKVMVCALQRGILNIRKFV